MFIKKYLASVIILTIIFASGCSYLLPKEKRTQNASPITPGGPPLYDRPFSRNPAISLEEAQLSVSFRIRVPDYVPAGLSLQKVYLEETRDEGEDSTTTVVDLVYARSSFDNDSLMKEVYFGLGGLRISEIMYPLAPSPEEEDIMIGNKKTKGHGYGPQFYGPTRNEFYAVGLLSWSEGDIDLICTGDYPLEELKKVAASME